MNRSCPDFVAQLQGYSLTTAEILYRMPDHQSLLQTYIWQEYDIAPVFPKLKQFLEYWIMKLDGPLFKVTVAHRKLLKPAEIKLLGTEILWH